MERERSWERVTHGLELRSRWQQLADRHGLLITHIGLPALTGFAIPELSGIGLQDTDHPGNAQEGLLSCYELLHLLGAHA